MKRGVIDVGSNSVLLVLAEKNLEIWTPFLETSEVTSLGVGVKQSGLLSESGITQTLEALKRAFDTAADKGVPEPLAAATMAARIATNQGEFLERAAAQRTPVKVLSGDDEAELGFLAIASDPAFAEYDRLSIIDVGGQSTEFFTADKNLEGWTTRLRQSFSIGTLALLATSLAEEKPDYSAVLWACEEIDNVFGLAYLPGKSGCVVALGATGTNLVSIREGLPIWNPGRVHGAHLDYEEVSKAAAWLFGMTVAERETIVGIEAGRERTLPIGALILERALFAMRATGCRVSVRGWRHALLERGHI